MDLGRRPEARFTDGEEDLLEREVAEATSPTSSTTSA